MTALLPIPREFVHRTDDRDVLLTHFQSRADGTYRMATRWPHAHALFAPLPGGGHNPMLMAETIRQAGAAVAHMAYGAPTDLRFLLWDLRYDVPESVLDAGLPLSPATATVRFADVRRRGGRLSSFRFEVDLHRGDLRVGHGAASATCVTPAAYGRLRPPRPRAVAEVPEPLPPALVGRDRPADVLLAATGRRDVWRLRAEPGHPVVFDSQSDHMPGRALIEAMRQAVQVATGCERIVIPSLSAEFRRYVELDRPCHVTAALPRSPGRPARVTLVQDGEVAAEGELTVRAS
ncbi:ScbA/BarX family gamma-butyrolactone biosynthesis protein [Streptomyces sp. 7R007]